MSAWSNWVTCGMDTQLRCSAGPEICWTRDSVTSSISPYLAKSTCGAAATSRPPPAAAPPDCMACLTWPLRSSSVMRPLRPEPRSEEHTSELQSRGQLVCRLLLEKENTRNIYDMETCD